MLYVLKKLYLCFMAKKETIYAAVYFDKESTKKIRELKKSYREQSINVSIGFIVNKLISKSTMKILLLILALTLSSCVPAHAQSKWYELLDSTGNNLYTKNGDILLVTVDSLTTIMKSEIDTWIEDKNKQPEIPFKSGVELHNDKWTANKDFKTGKWSIYYNH